MTAKDYVTQAFHNKGWETEKKVSFNTDKRDCIDLFKDKIGIEIEFSRFEMFFRDFFRFLLLYAKRGMDAGLITILDDMTYKRWEDEAKLYKSARGQLPYACRFLKRRIFISSKCSPMVYWH